MTDDEMIMFVTRSVNFGRHQISTLEEGKLLVFDGGYWHYRAKNNFVAVPALWFPIEDTWRPMVVHEAITGYCLTTLDGDLANMSYLTHFTDKCAIYVTAEQLENEYTRETKGPQDRDGLDRICGLWFKNGKSTKLATDVRTLKKYLYSNQIELSS